MTEAYVDHLSYALGDVRQSLAEAEARQQLVSDPSALEGAGFAHHHVCSADVDAYSLARATVEPLRERLGTIDIIIYSTCLPINGSVHGQAEFEASRDVKHFMSFPASHLMADFDLTSARVIGLNQQACTGMIGSIALARDLLAANPDNRRVLCVTADRFPEQALYEQSYNLISDGGAACIVSDADSGYRILGHFHVTNGGMVNANDDETVGSFFSFSHQVISAAVNRAGLTIADIDWVVPQNTNVKAWEILTRLLGVDMERVFLGSIAEVGHVISGDNIINLKQLADEGRLERGQRLLLFMAGYGSNWQALVLEVV